MKRFYYNQVVRRAAQKGRIISVSNVSSSRIAAAWPELATAITVIPNGVAETFRTVGRENRSGFIIFASERWHKNLAGMVAAYRVYLAAQPSDRCEPLNVVGSEAAFMRVAGDTVGDMPVRFYGRVDDIELHRLYAKAAGLLFCSFEEGFGLPVIEAISAGCPVVAADIPSLREVATPASCIFVDPHSISDMARGMSEILDKRVTDFDALSIGGKFNWDVSYEMLKDVINELM